MNLSRFWFLSRGGTKLLGFETMDSSMHSSSRKNSANLNLLQNASMSFVISSVLFLRGVGVNLSPFSRTLICFSVSVLSDKFITLTSP